MLRDTISYSKCENMSRINVRLLYVWGELRGNLPPEGLSLHPMERAKTELTAPEDYHSEPGCVLVTRPAVL